MLNRLKASYIRSYPFLLECAGRFDPDYCETLLELLASLFDWALSDTSRTQFYTRSHDDLIYRVIMTSVQYALVNVLENDVQCSVSLIQGIEKNSLVTYQRLGV